MNTSLWSLLLAGAVLTAACGDSKSSLNPTAPSALSAATQNSEAGSTDAVSTATGGKGNNGGGNGNGGGKPDDPGNGGGKPDNPGNGGGKPDNPGNGNQPTVPSAPQPPTNTSPAAPGLSKVEIEGLISAKSTDSITVNGQIVVVPSTCVIRHGSTTFQLSDLNVGDRVHVRAARITAGTGSTATTTLEATEVKLQNPGDGDDSDDDEDDDLPPTLLVSVAAFDSTASETGPDMGTFRFSRTGSTAASLTVTFAVTGTATNGTDYQSVPLTVTFAAGQATTDLFVIPLSDGTAEGSETVIVTVTDGASYDVGAPASATVTITG